MKRLNAIIRKEFLHILRDPRSLTIVFVLPVMMIFFYGYSVTLDLKRIDFAVIDWSRSAESGKFLDNFRNNSYYVQHPIRDLGTDKNEIDSAEEMLRQGEIRQYLVIPADFAERISSRRTAQVGIIIDGSDANVCNLVYQYNEQILMQYMLERTNMKDLLRISTHFFFNPEAKSSFFFIPGLAAVLLLMISSLLTSISIAREKETGSIDLLFISPLRSREIILGKTIPYILVAFAAGSFILLFAKFWFKIPIRGNLLVLLAFSLLYIFCGLSFGIMVSAIATTQRIATIAALLLTMLPSIILSGFFFPLDSMPAVIRGFSYIVPATYYLRIIRGVVIKGAGIESFWFEGLMLLGLSMLLVTVAIRRFERLRRKRI